MRHWLNRKLVLRLSANDHSINFLDTPHRCWIEAARQIQLLEVDRLPLAFAYVADHLLMWPLVCFLPGGEPHLVERWIAVLGEPCSEPGGVWGIDNLRQLLILRLRARQRSQLQSTASVQAIIDARSLLLESILERGHVAARPPRRQVIRPSLVGRRRREIGVDVFGMLARLNPALWCRLIWRRIWTSKRRVCGILPLNIVQVRHADRQLLFVTVCYCFWDIA